MNARSVSPWNLVADIGGTHARLGLVTSGELRPRLVRHFDLADHAGVDRAVAAFLASVARQHGWQTLPGRACIAVACAVDGDVVRLTNGPWSIERRALVKQLGGAPVELVNDFAAVGHALGALDAGDWYPVAGGSPDPARPVVALGPGTGLGVCTVVPSKSGPVVVDGEGGHVDFAPVTRREADVLRVLAERFEHVSIERVLSGDGLVNLYRALAVLEGLRPTLSGPTDVSAAARVGSDPIAVEALAIFLGVLGSVAGNLALTFGARGGVYIAGGIVPQLLDLVAGSPLRARFEAKGRFRDYLASIPLRIVTLADPGLVGAAARLARTA